MYFLKLGTLGFGGQVALVGYVHRNLVEGRGRISEAEYKEGVALAQLMLGSLAAQLGIYIGYFHYSAIGATLTGLVFVLPSVLMVLALGWVSSHSPVCRGCRRYSTALARRSLGSSRSASTS